MAKNRIVLICLLLAYSCIHFSFQPTEVEYSTSKKIESVYISQLGKVEVPRGSNWGKDVSGYLKSVNVRVPAAWCAGFVKWCYDSAGVKTNITAWSPTAHNKNNLVYSKGRYLKTALPGDAFTIWYVSLKRIAHTGFYHRTVNSSIIETVEGNTNDGGSRDGYGVFKRRRPINTIYSISRHY